MKSMPKGQFIVMKTGVHPMISKLKLYFKWGIKFEEEYRLPDKATRPVSYKDCGELIRDVSLKYPPKKEVFQPESDDEELPKKKNNIRTRG